MISILLQRHISKLSKYSSFTFPSVHASEPYKQNLRTKRSTLLLYSLNVISKVQPTRCNVFSIYFYELLYMFQAVPLPIIRSTKLYIQRQVLSNQYCCLQLSWMRWNVVLSHPERNSISSTIAAVLVSQYLTLYVQFVLLMMGGVTA
jgi:hypothetical protein